MRHLALPVLVLFILAGCAHTARTGSPHRSEVSDQGPMAMLVSFNYQQVPLRQVITELATRYDFDTAIQDHALPQADGLPPLNCSRSYESLTQARRAEETQQCQDVSGTVRNRS